MGDFFREPSRPKEVQFDYKAPMALGRQVQEKSHMGLEG